MIDQQITKRQKEILMSIIIIYFAVGFVLILIFLTKYFGSNGASFIGIAYLGVGWLFLYRWNGIFKIMKIKYK